MVMKSISTILAIVCLALGLMSCGGKERAACGKFKLFKSSTTNADGTLKNPSRVN